MRPLFHPQFSHFLKQINAVGHKYDPQLYEVGEKKPNFIETQLCAPLHTGQTLVRSSPISTLAKPPRVSALHLRHLPSS